jgi:hypothetical protein
VPQIEITRQSAYENATVAYFVYVDDANAANIRDGETKSVEVTEGYHVVQCSAGPLGSPNLEIYVGGAGAKLFCRPSRNYRRAFPTTYVELWEDDVNATRGVVIPQEGSGPPSIAPFYFVVLLVGLPLAIWVARPLVKGELDPSVWVTLALALGIGLVGFYLNRRSKRRGR